ncbi:MAG: TIGR00296 family protein, partial [Candidatus Hydrothermarchaeales archaeon]
MDEKDGELLLKLSRRAISEYLKHGKVIKAPEDVKEELKEKRGVFVTLTTYPDKRLRGCIGFPEPIKPLIEAVIEAAISSATRDPRFHPVSLQELPHITVEVTVLTPPDTIDAKTPEETLEKIEIGRHGLIIEKGMCRGLLLPQVPV